MILAQNIYNITLKQATLMHKIMVCFAHMLGLRRNRHSSPNTTLSENVSYNIVGQTVRMSAQVDLTCSGNISYATVEEVNKKDTDKSTVATSHIAVYDDVELNK